MNYGKVLNQAASTKADPAKKPVTTRDQTPTTVATVIPEGSIILHPMSMTKGLVKSDEVRAALDLSRSRVKEIDVVDQASAAQIIDLASGAKKAAKVIEAALKAVIAEPESRIRELKAFAKTFIELAESIESTAKTKVSAWQQAERIRIQNEENEKKRLAAEANRKLAHDALKSIANQLGLTDAQADKALKGAELPPLSSPDFPATEKYEQAREALVNSTKAPTQTDLFKEPPRVDLPTAKETPAMIRTEGGAKSTTAKVWTFKVMNEAEIPREYLVLDEKKVRDAIRVGTRNIAGLEIYQADQLRFG
jgi:hypothetical protein